MKGAKKICPHCGKEFETHYLDKIYCSRECYNKAKNERQKLYEKQKREQKREQKDLPPKIIKVRGKCLACGKTFNPAFATEKFCSDKCRCNFF